MHTEKHKLNTHTDTYTCVLLYKLASRIHRLVQWTADSHESYKVPNILHF